MVEVSKITLVMYNEKNTRINVLSVGAAGTGIEGSSGKRGTAADGKSCELKRVRPLARGVEEAREEEREEAREAAREDAREGAVIPSDEARVDFSGSFEISLLVESLGPNPKDAREGEGGVTRED